MRFICVENTEQGDTSSVYKIGSLKDQPPIDTSHTTKLTFNDNEMIKYLQYAKYAEYAEYAKCNHILPHL